MKHNFELETEQFTLENLVNVCKLIQKHKGYKLVIDYDFGYQSGPELHGFICQQHDLNDKKLVLYADNYLVENLDKNNPFTVLGYLPE